MERRRRPAHVTHVAPSSPTSPTLRMLTCRAHVPHVAHIATLRPRHPRCTLPTSCTPRCRSPRHADAHAHVGHPTRTLDMSRRQPMPTLLSRWDLPTPHADARHVRLFLYKIRKWSGSAEGPVEIPQGFFRLNRVKVSSFHLGPAGDAPSPAGSTPPLRGST
jgi:hypothetical protein